MYSFFSLKELKGLQEPLEIPGRVDLRDPKELKATRDRQEQRDQLEIRERRVVITDSTTTTTNTNTNTTNTTTTTNNNNNNVVTTSLQFYQICYITTFQNIV